ncbi:MAG: hypothetical protein GX322_03645 [Firmicutes bacterium]|nr:hypothetical protein [Bacillota bacterium]
MSTSADHCRQEIFLGPPLFVKETLFVPVVENMLYAYSLDKSQMVSGHMRPVAILCIAPDAERIWYIYPMDLSWDQLVAERSAWEKRVHGCDTSGLG